MRSIQLTLAVLGATALLAIGITGASAAHLSSNDQNIRVVWSSLEFAGGTTIRCKLTLEGSFHSRTIEKVRESLIGLVTRATMSGSSCTNGRGWAENGVETAPLGTLANTLPWHITYFSFEGSLPAIGGIRLLLRRIRLVAEVRILGLTCIGRYGTETDRIVGRVNRNSSTGVVENLIPVSGSNALNLVNQLGDNVCPSSGTFGAPATDGRVTVLNSSNNIAISLI